MFTYLLLFVLVAAAVHVLRSEERGLRRVGRIVLLYVLVGYCGVPMLAVSLGVLLVPDHAAEVLGFPSGNPFQTFLGFAYLGMSLAAVLAVWYRDSFVIGPALCWAVFFAGATFIHLDDYGARGALTHHSLLAILTTHALISLLLLGGLLASGVLWERA